MAQRRYIARFEHTAERVYRAFTSREYWDAKMEEFRKLTPQSDIDSMVVNATGVGVTLTQVLPRTELPSIAQTVMKKDMVITRQEFFAPFDPNRTKGCFAASIPSGPGSLQGWIELVAEGSGCYLERVTEVTVDIPLINGKIENLILENLDDLFGGEDEFTTAWLAENESA
jgi:hypothetical protein